MAKKTVREHRFQAGMTQKELGAAAGVTLRTIQRMETNVDMLQGTTYRNLKRVADALGTKICHIDMKDEHQADEEEFDPIT